MNRLSLLLMVSIPLFSQTQIEHLGWEPGRLIVKLKAGVEGSRFLENLKKSPELRAHAKATGQETILVDINPIFPRKTKRQRPKPHPQETQIVPNQPAKGKDPFPERHCFQTITLTKQNHIPTLAKLVTRHPDVDWAEPDHLIGLAASDGTNSALPGWHHDYLNIQDTWNQVGQGQPGIVIAVIDSGVDLQHPNLGGHLWTNIDENQNQSDDDQNGYVDDASGWDFVNQDIGQDGLARAVPPHFMEDLVGHGTHCAGIVVAQGGLGAAPGCRVMPLKAFESSGISNVSTIVPAIYYALEKGAQIISMSFSLNVDSLSLRDVLLQASAGSLLVAAAGNQGLSRDRLSIYPAHYPFVLGVEALSCQTENGNLLPAVFSNLGYDLQVPGVSIASTLPNAGFGNMSGTSMATPLAAGVGALIWSAKPNLTPGQVFNRLQQFQADSLKATTQQLPDKLAFSGIQVTDTCAFPCIPDNRASLGEGVEITIKILNQGDPVYNVVGWLAGQPVFFGDTGANETASGKVNYTVVQGGLVGTLVVQNMDPVVIRLPLVKYLPTVIQQNTTLTDDTIYIQAAGLTVDYGARLTIAEGTRLEIATSEAIFVKGTLDAQGTQTNPIHIQVNESINWAGLDFSDSDAPLFSSNGTYSDGNRLQNCILSSGSKDITNPSGTAVSGPAYLSNNVFRGFATAVDCSSGSATGIEENLFEFNGIAIDGFTMAESLAGVVSPSCPTTACDDLDCVGFNFIRRNSFVKSIDASIRVVDVASSPKNPAVIYQNNFLKDPSVADHLTKIELVLPSGVSACMFPKNYWAIPTLPDDKIDGDYLDLLSYQSLPPAEASPVVSEIILTPVHLGEGHPVVSTNGKVTFEVHFSQAMDTSSSPVLSIGKAAPFNTRMATQGSWNLAEDTWATSIEMDYCLPDGLYTAVVSEARNKEGLPIPSLDCRFQFSFGGLSGTCPNSVASQGRICLEWDDLIEADCSLSVCDSVVAYNVYRRQPNDAGFLKINTQPVFENSFEDRGVTFGQTYSYMVRPLSIGFVEGAASMPTPFLSPLSCEPNCP